MLKKVQLSQETVAWVILEHQLLHAILNNRQADITTYAQRLSRYDSNLLNGYWTEVFDQYDAVKGKEERGKIIRSTAVPRRGPHER